MWESCGERDESHGRGHGKLYRSDRLSWALEHKEILLEQTGVGSDGRGLRPGDGRTSRSHAMMDVGRLTSHCGIMIVGDVVWSYGN